MTDGAKTALSPLIKILVATMPTTIGLSKRSQLDPRNGY